MRGVSMQFSQLLPGISAVTVVEKEYLLCRELFLNAGNRKSLDGTFRPAFAAQVFPLAPELSNRADFGEANPHS